MIIYPQHILLAFLADCNKAKLPWINVDSPCLGKCNSEFCDQVGIGLEGVVISSMVVGGPAYNCGLLDIGDRILSVNGVAVHDQNINEALTGADIPGSPSSDSRHRRPSPFTVFVHRGSAVHDRGKASIQKPPNQLNGQGSDGQAAARRERIHRSQP
jgi:hypothetical protein